MFELVFLPFNVLAGGSPTRRFNPVLSEVGGACMLLMLFTVISCFRTPLPSSDRITKRGDTDQSAPLEAV